MKWFKINLVKDEKRKIWFWEDMWIGDFAIKSLFPRIYYIASSMNFINQCWSTSTNSLVVPLRRNLIDDKTLVRIELYSLLEKNNLRI